MATGVYLLTYHFLPTLPPLVPARQTGSQATKHSDDQVTGKPNNRESIFSRPLNECPIESTESGVETKKKANLSHVV